MNDTNVLCPPTHWYADKTELEIEVYDTVLFSLDKLHNCVTVDELCDQYYTCKLDKNDLDKLISKLTEFRSMLK